MIKFKRIGVSEVAQFIADDSATICDIRDEQSYATSHIEGSFHLSNGSMVQLLDKVDFDRPIVVVCYHGVSSQGAAQYLTQQGFETVYSMDGGFTEWAKHYAFVDDKQQ